ncbi:uncharacterized protein SAZU_2353 [Streptomyces azureus]|uniref:Uncharacterized protein n=1 Tax=Streptomyces azureus TaxID=146537 RepID=A0A0K8PIA6_STRAJ|nr:uncharacterized protein SAZU_2353 [Streptomyces azureus]
MLLPTMRHPYLPTEGWKSPHPPRTPGLQTPDPRKPPPASHPHSPSGRFAARHAAAPTQDVRVHDEGTLPRATAGEPAATAPLADGKQPHPAEALTDNLGGVRGTIPDTARRRSRQARQRPQRP